MVSAIEKPIPLAAPVMIETLSFNIMIALILSTNHILSRKNKKITFHC
jgi:hypothetical protein